MTAAPQRLSETVTLPTAGPAAADFAVLEARLAATEATFAESQTMLTDALQCSLSWIWEADSELRFTRIIGPIEQALGTKPEKLIGQLVENFSRAPNDQSVQAHLATLKAHKPYHDAIVPITTRRGTRYLRASGAPLYGADGAFMGYRGIACDVTDHVQAEHRATEANRRFIEAIENVPASLMLCDAEDRIVFCNSATQRYFPMAAHLLVPGTKYEELLRAHVASGYVQDVDADFERWIAERMGRHRAANSSIIRAYNDGRYSQIIERRTSEGGVIAIRLDITELKRREEELRRAERQFIEAKNTAESANRAKSDFLANMSHELRTPLNAIIGFSEIMMQETLGPLGHASYREYVRDVRESGIHLLKIINDILDLSKIEVGQLTLNDSPIDLRDAIECCMRIVRERATGAGIELISDLAGDLPTINADERMVKQMLLNLLANAIKFTPKGSVRIVAGCAEDQGAFIRVIDTGIGIAAKDIEKAMQPFVQIDSSLQRKYTGTGLGLPLASSMAELHGGRLAIESEVGVGTTVTLFFPPSRTLIHAPVAALVTEIG
jgi:two-component system cell cycle sensor histidine kinase PleC